MAVIFQNLTFIAQAKGGDPMGTILFIGFMFLAMWFFMIQPQRKRQKEHQKMLSNLQKGDEIVTTGGLYAVITSIKDDRLVVRIGDSTKAELGKSFVHGKVVKAIKEKGA